MLLERYPGERITECGARNEFEEMVERYGVNGGRRSGLPLRTGDDRAGDPMIQHDMSTCILCTRCVRACADIQVVGVLDVAYRGDHAEIIVGADGNPDHAGCTWCGECVRVCPTGAIHDVLPLAKFARDALQKPAHSVRSVCPYCGVGCQLDLEVRGSDVVRVNSPWIEENTPNMGSTCVKGRFGTDFVLHRDRLTTPLIRKGWVKRDGRWRFEPDAAHLQRLGPARRPMAPDRGRVANEEAATEVQSPSDAPGARRSTRRPTRPRRNARTSGTSRSAKRRGMRRWRSSRRSSRDCATCTGRTRWRYSARQNARTRRTTFSSGCSGPALERTTWTTARACAIRRR